VVSLYGLDEGRLLARIADLDAVVFDLQGAGVRFYTYVSTLIHLLRAAGGTEIEIVVLDRPNPLGGDYVAGPVPDPRDELAESLVNTAPGPLVHGLTMGEMARFANRRLDEPARLHVVPLAGWRRTMTWPDTGRSWIAPSPNLRTAEDLRTAEAALAYPGTCLLEATNVSEGRGSASPFLLIGAPWLRSAALAARLHAPGFTFSAERFTPISSKAAPRPKYVGQAVQGLRVRVTAPAQARPYELGVRLLYELRRQQPELRWLRPDALDQLVGTRSLRAALERGDTVEAILAADQDEIDSFRLDRQPALLY
jgi:uncharacterized protein YbbC (DUF1343 family)